MANQSIQIPEKTFVDITATATLTAGSYVIQAMGSAVYLDEQTSQPSDTSDSLLLVNGGQQTITQAAENFYAYALEPCKIIIAEAP